MSYDSLSHDEMADRMTSIHEMTDPKAAFVYASVGDNSVIVNFNDAEDIAELIGLIAPLSAELFQALVSVVGSPTGARAFLKQHEAAEPVESYDCCCCDDDCEDEDSEPVVGVVQDAFNPVGY